MASLVVILVIVRLVITVVRWGRLCFHLRRGPTGIYMALPTVYGSGEDSFDSTGRDSITSVGRSVRVNYTRG